MMKEPMVWDAFVSHASEDKDGVARPIFDTLTKMGANVWFDEAELKVGDSLLRKIDEGLAKSRFGIVVLSKPFLDKGWPDYELRGLVSREMGRDKVVLPVWYGITRDDLLERMPSLADKFALATDGTDVDRVCVKLLEVIRPDLSQAIARRMAFKLSIARAERRVVDLGSLKISPFRHDALPAAMLGRIRLIRSVLLSVYPLSFDEWVDNFRRDTHPSRELEIWERLAVRYQEIMSSASADASSAYAVFRICLMASMGTSIDGLLSAENLPKNLEATIRGTLASERPIADIDPVRDGAEGIGDIGTAHNNERFEGDETKIDEALVDRLLMAQLRHSD